MRKMKIASDHKMLEEVKRSFADCARPEHFTDYENDEEFAEHDGLLRSRDLDSLRIEDVNNPAWNPINSISPAGFCYYFPALTRFALTEPTNEWYMQSLLFQLTYEGEQNRFLKYFSVRHRAVVVEFLDYVLKTRKSLIEQFSCESDIMEALEIWSGVPGSN